MSREITTTLDGCKNIDSFVYKQTEKLKNSKQDFQTLFEIMFSVRNNVMFERTDGNKIYKLTYGECYDKIGTVAYNLKNECQNIDRNSLVGIYMDNRIEWIQVFWAILMAGYRPLLINKRLSEDRLEHIIKQHNVRVVVTDDKNFSCKNIEFENLYKESGELKENEWADEILLMTSGTSLNVKLCSYKGESFCQQIYNSSDIIKRSNLIKAHYEGNLKLLTFLPFYHIFGLVALYMWFAFFSRTFVLLKDLSGETVLNTIKKHKVTHLFAVPMVWEKVESLAKKKIASRGEKVEKKFYKGLRISNNLQNICPSLGRKVAKKLFKEVRQGLFGDCVQFLISGGGAISKSTLEFFNGIGYRLADGYGMTEIGITSVELSDKPKWLNSASVGQTFKSVEYKIVDGHLLVRGQSLADKIYSDDKVIEIKQDWFDTGDMAREKHGHFYILGREDDMIVGSAGENICPDEIENKIKVPDANLVMLALKGDDDKIRSTLIVSINKYFSSKKVQSIKEELFNKLSQYDLGKLIDDVYYTNDELITGSDFKLNRKKIAIRVKNGEIRLKDIKTIENIAVTEINKQLQKEIIEIFEKALERSLEEKEYGMNFFFELGGDSLSYFSIIEDVKSKYNISLPLDEDNIVSVNGICEYLQDKLN